MVLELFPLDPSIGYLGLFAVSFIGSVIIFLPIPFFLLLATMSLDSAFDPTLLAITSAIGSTAAKMIIFYGSYYGRNILGKDTKKRMLPLQRLVSRYGWIATFIAAATPVPDDLVYIPLGLSRYNPLRFFSATLAGKIVISIIIAWGTRSGLSSYIDPLIGSVKDPAIVYMTTIILTAIMGIIIYYTIKIDWSKIIGKFFPWTIDDEN